MTDLLHSRLRQVSAAAVAAVIILGPAYLDALSAVQPERLTVFR